MLNSRLKPWGNSLGIIIPSEIIREFNLKPHETISFEIKGKTHNVLAELFGTLTFNHPTKELLQKTRKNLEGKL